MRWFSWADLRVGLFCFRGGVEAGAEGLVEVLEGVIALGGEALDVVAELVQLRIAFLTFLFEGFQAMF